MFDQEITDNARHIVSHAGEHGLWLTTAESCTGGLIAGALTSIAGSSSCVGSGFVTYSNEAKQQALNVSAETLTVHGAVSEAVAKEMAMGARQITNADLAIAVTGIAGPGGGTEMKPVGLVYIAIDQSTSSPCRVEKFLFGDIGRGQVRRETVLSSLVMAIDCLGLSNPLYT